MQLKDFKDEIYKCIRCGFCREMVLGQTFRICPLREKLGFESSYARGRMIIARAILEGELTYDQQLIERIYCTLCGNCMVHCPLEIKTVEVFKALRADIVKSGCKLPENIEVVISNIRTYHDAFLTLTKKAWPVPKKTLAEGAELLYFAGCVARNKYPSIIRASIKILEAAGVGFTVLGEDEWCCGNPLFSYGELDLAKEVAEHNVAKIRELGVKKVVVSCAGCYKTLKTEYPKILGKIDFEVIHLSELLKELVEKGKIAFNAEHSQKLAGKVVAYHDPCELGRLSGVYDSPRKVIKSIPNIKFVEFQRNRENSWCCGAGGGFKAFNPKLAVDIAYDRVDEAVGLGANTIVSCCPTCKWNLTEAVRRKKMNVEVLDLSELLVSAMSV